MYLSPPHTPENSEENRSTHKQKSFHQLYNHLEAMSRLPLKKRQHAMQSGEEDLDASLSAPLENDSPLFASSNSPPVTPPSHHDSPLPAYACSLPAYATSPLPTYASPMSPPPTMEGSMSPHLGDRSPSPLLMATNSSAMVPEKMKNFFPENIFSFNDEQQADEPPSSGAKPKKKEKTFVYYINGHPLNKPSKKGSSSSSRGGNSSRSHAISESSASNSMSNQPGPSRIHEPLDMSQYSLPHPPIMNPSHDFLSNAAPSYGHFDPSLLHGSLLGHAPMLSMSSPFASFGAPGIFPPLMQSNKHHEDGLSIYHAPETPKKKKPQQCRYCANHDTYERVKGHKYNCKWRECPCKECCVTRNRQIAVRQQAKQTRQQESQKNQLQLQGGIDPLFLPSTSDYGSADPDSFDQHSQSFDEDDDYQY